MKLRRAMAVACLIAAIVAVSLRGGTLVYTFLYLSILLPVGSIAYTAYVSYKLKIAQRIESRFAVKNEPTGYLCRIANESLTPFTRIELVPCTKRCRIESLGDSPTYRLDEGESVNIRSMVTCERRGECRIGIDEIIVSDLLGLARLRYKVKTEYNIMVFPRVLVLDSLSIISQEGSALTGMSAEKIPGDSVRSYIPGDDPRLIHWKSSARSGELKTRNMSSIERAGVTLVLDTYRYAIDEGSIAREDNMLETLLAVSRYCTSHMIDVEVYAGSKQFFISSETAFLQLYDWSCHMSFSREEPEASLPQRLGRCCICLTETPTPELERQLCDAARGGVQSVLMAFGGQELPKTDAVPLYTRVAVPDDADIAALLS